MRRFALLAGSVVCVVVLGALTVWAQVSSGRQASRVHDADRVTLQATLAGLTQQYVEFTFLSTKTAADDGNWSLQPGDAADHRALRRLVQDSPLTSYGAAVVSLTGAPLSSYPASNALPAPTDPGFTSLRTDLLAGQPGLSDVMHVNGTPVVAFAVPINRSGRPAALLVTFANLRTWPLQGYTAKLHLGTGAQSIIVDRNGVAAAASDPADIGTPLKGLPADALAGSTGLERFNGPDGATVVSYGPAGSGWTALTLQPASAFSGFLDRSRNLQSLALALLLSIAVLMLSLFHHKRQRALARLAEERLHDPLTGLAQRAVFEMRLEAAMARHRRSGRPLTVLFCDVDNFKQVNDRHGHNIGDQLLVTIARRMTAAVRDTDMVVRLGGDEFAVVMEETGVDEAREICDRVDAEVSASVTLNGQPFEPRLSIGGAVLADERGGIDVLLHEADMAMYEAKRNGARCVIVPTTGADTPVVPAQDPAPSDAPVS